jgi:hypothetical protein
MAEFEAAEAGLGAASRAAELSRAAEEGADAFNKVLSDNKIDPTYVQIDPATGKPIFTYNGESINLEDLKNEYYDFETGDPPNFEELLKKMNFKEDEINTPEMKDFIKQKTEEFNKNWKDYQDMKKIEKAQKALADKHTPPTKPEEVTTRINKKTTAEVQKSWNDIIKSGVEGAGKVGKWVAETAIKLAPYGIAGILLYNVVKDHQAACNGCWKIEKANPSNRCKITDLTCSDEARTKGDIMCATCDAIDVDLCKNRFNPCLINSDNKFYNKCSDADKTDKTKCSTDGFYLGPGTDGKNCSNKVKSPDTDGCPKTDSGSDSSEWCSSNCNCDNSDNCSDGKYFLQCVNYNFWGALADLTDTPIEELGKLLGDTGSTILNILKYVAIGIVVLISILVVFEIISFFIRGGYHSSNENKQQLEYQPAYQQPYPAAYPNANTGNPFDKL